MENCLQIYIRKVPEPAEIDPEVVKDFPERRRAFIERAVSWAAAASYAAGLLMRDVLGVRRDEDLYVSSHGKPFLADGSRQFSLSHSSELAVLAVSEEEVGVDTETVKPLPESVAERIFTDEERSYLTEDPDRRGVVLWTRLEAVLKLTGDGIPGINRRKRNGVSLLVQGKPFYVHTEEIGGSVVSTACAADLPVHFIIL